MIDPDHYRDSAEAVHNLRNQDQIDDATLALVLVDIAYLALEARNTSDALYILSGMPRGFQGFLRTAVERAPMSAETVFKLATLLLERGVVTEGVDTTLFGSVDTPRGQVS